MRRWKCTFITFYIAIIKWLTRSNLRKERFISANCFRVQTMAARTAYSRISRGMRLLMSQCSSKGKMKASKCVTFRQKQGLHCKFLRSDPWKLTSSHMSHHRKFSQLPQNSATTSEKYTSLWRTFKRT